MVVFFPVPRDELPVVRVTIEEQHGRRTQMQRMLESLVEEYERYLRHGRRVDSRRWKSSTSRDRLKLFKERFSAEASGFGLNSDFTNNCSTDAGSTEMRRTNCISVANSPMSFSEEGADLLKMTLMVGDCPGRMENAMYAVLAADQSELAMVDIFLHEDVADCAILHTIDGPTEDDPYHFLGYKWFVRKSPTTSHLVKHRDSVYVEYSGLTKTRSGDQIGYHIMHSVDLLGFPEMPHRNCLRTSQSIRSLYRQRPNNVVEVFSVGNVDPAGMLKGPLATLLAQETLFNMPKLIECGESKRLASMLHAMRRIRDERMSTKRHIGGNCALCRHQKNIFSGSMDVCNVCGLDVCGNCRLNKRVFRSQGVLGHFVKIICCKTCVLVVANAKAHGTDLRLPQETSLSPSRAQPPTASSIRTLAEQLHIRQPSASQAQPPTNALTNRPTSANTAKQTSRMHEEVETLHHSPATPLAHPQVVPLPRESSASSTPTTDRSRGVSIGSASSSFHTPVTSPSTEIMLLQLPGESASAAPVIAHTPPPSTVAPAVPQPQADLYMKMLELQRKAQDAYVTTQLNQHYCT